MRRIPLKAVTKFLKQCWFFFAALIIFAAIISSLFRALTPWAKQYKSQVEQHLSAFLGEPVVIGSMETGWYWFEPVIKLKQVRVLKGNHEVVQLKKLLVGINLFSSLWQWQIQPGVLYIDGLDLSLRQSNGNWRINGLEGVGKSQNAFDTSSYQPILAWVLAQQKIIIKNFSTTLYLQDKSVIPVRALNLTVINRGGHYYVKGNASLREASDTSFQLLAEMVLDPYALKKSGGRIYFSVKRLQLPSWQKFLPDSRFKIYKGVGDVQLWLDWHNGAVESAQSRVSIRDLQWQDGLTNSKQLVRYANANLALIFSKTGWQITADHVMLGLGATNWPENKLMVRYQNNNQTFYVYVKQFFLGSLKSVAPYVPTDFNSLLAVHPHGEFRDTQVTFKAPNVEYLLTKFSKVGWSGVDAMPGVENLAGVIHWQPTEGLLEIDSENTTLQVANKPAVLFKTLNAAFNWKELSHGLRVTMERLVIEHPDLLVSASGAVDDVSMSSVGQLNLIAQVSATNVQRWLTYLPSKGLKPKFEAWLKHDIKHVDSLVAEITVNGLASHFPFDKLPGEFLIKGHARGVDLIFARGWPLVKDLDAFLQVDKRTLNVDVVHAKVQETVVTNGNIRIADIGYDHETLLLHTNIDANSKNALAYILSTPLNKKLKTLKMLQAEGVLNLDLRLEAPLYPENDDILALGDITIKNNNIIINHILNDLQLNSVNGSLQFNQSGVLDSRLTAHIMKYPVSVFIQSVQKPTPSLQVKFQAKTSIDVLRQRFNVPILSLLQGDFGLESLLTITDKPNDFDHVKITTSLLGVAVNLPEPFRKPLTSSAPLTIDVDFNPEKALRVRMNYNKQLSGDLWFTGQKGRFQLEKGEIRLGSEESLRQKKAGLQIVGVLSTFDLQQWRDAFLSLPNDSTDKSFRDSIQLIDVMLKQTSFGNQHYPEMAIKASRVKNNEWSIGIRQHDISAQLHYQLRTNSLSGTFVKLRLQDLRSTSNAVNKLEPSSLHARDMPNLDLKINSFEYGDLNVGEISINASSHNQVWQLDFCKIATPFYQLTAKGQWSEANKTSATRVQGDLQITDLARSLARWKITPVVEAHKGSIQFQGYWPGAFYDFSLAKVSGQVAIAFKNGRITNLSPDTEEKLGLGKLLSVLSLQTIPRRLKLDFSDLSHDGYSFDEFKGNFNVANGLMSTQDSFINGPIAYASMKGSLDIARQFYNLELKISPHVTASLPVVATIAGGPIAGIATWVVSKIINKGMQKISGYTYKISGPWKQPLVQQVTIIRKKK